MAFDQCSKTPLSFRCIGWSTVIPPMDCDIPLHVGEYNLQSSATSRSFELCYIYTYILNIPATVKLDLYGLHMDYAPLTMWYAHSSLSLLLGMV